VFARAIPFTPEHDQEVFAEVPARPGVFLLRPAEAGAEPYISKSSNLRRRITKLLATPEEGFSKRLNLRDRCAQIEFTETGSDFENTLLLYRALRHYFPKTYTKRLRLSPPALVKFDWANAYPRAYVTTKLSKLGAEGGPTYYGPFRSRAVAEKYANDVLDLFKSRRCTFELDPDPSFPGCVYSEMKMCLAPCFKGCTDEEYMAETRRVEEFVRTRGESLIMPLAAERDQASEQLAFEAAKTLHEKVEKLKAIAREADELVRRIDELDAVIVAPGAEGLVLFRFNGCQICGPMKVITSPTGETPVVPKLEDIVEQLQATQKVSAAECIEHLAILKRWYYRSHKAGEMVFRNADGSWPMRKIANAAQRVTEPRSHGDTEASEPGKEIASGPAAT
jgi:excinuclease UvrABC nuclease subunit